MASSFDYDAPNVPDTAVADVVNDIVNNGKLPPLSDDEREQRRLNSELYRLQCQQRDEQRAFEYQQRRAEEEAIAREQAQIEQAEANRKARIERQERIDRDVRQREIADLRFQSAQHQAWQNNVTTSFRQTLANRQIQTIFGEIDSILNPPTVAPEPPEPEPEYPPEPKFGDPDFIEKWKARSPLRSWWRLD